MTVEFQSIPAMALESARRFGSAPAVIDGEGIISFDCLAAEMLSVARGLIARGVGKGDRVVLWAPNSARWISSALGVLATGAWLVPLNTRFKGPEASYILRKTGAQVVLAANGFLGGELLVTLAKTDPDLQLRERIVIDGSASSGVLAWEALVEAGLSVDESDVISRIRSIAPADISDVIFTSGTTGSPKGVLLRHGDSMRAYRAYNEGFQLHEGDRILIILPFFHCFGYKAGWMLALMSGATTVPMAVFDPSAVLHLVEEQGITHMGGSPTIFNALLAQLDLAEFDLSSLKVASVSAAYVPVELVRRMREELALDYAMTGYGLTESHGIVAITYPDDPPEVVANWCGKPLAGTEVRLVDGEGNDVPVGERGEVLFRGYPVSDGYFDEPEATAEVFQGGWLRTGDIAYANADGYIKVCDRKKDMYVSGGFNVAPAEVEGLLQGSPKILSAAVVGVPDEYLGEVGVAFVVGVPGVEGLTAEYVVDYARKVMANYKVPRRVEVLAEMPLNATGKVTKNELRARLV